MKFFVLMCSLLFVGCSHFQEPIEMYNMVTYNGETNTVRQCTRPVPYTISKRVPKNVRLAIDDAIDYWNVIYGDRLFLNMGDLDLTLESDNRFMVVLFDVSDNRPEDKDVAHTDYSKYPIDGCAGANVRIYSSALEGLSSASLETAIRHEIGHVLGLGHSDTIFDMGLMSPTLVRDLSEPVDLIEVELDAFNVIYNR